MLRVNDIQVFYGEMQILRGISLEVNQGEIVSLIGSNGAGKSTTMLSISGLIHPRKGEIEFNGKKITDLSPFDIVEMGISHVPEGRQLFPSLTVLENLEMGALRGKAKRERHKTMEWIFQLFPILNERKRQFAGTLSGGEQQMVAIGRGLMSIPSLLLLDEPSLGLAPIFVSSMYDIIKKINTEGTTILLVEQNVFKSLSICNRGYVLENGAVTLKGIGEDLLQNKLIKRVYLGM